MIPEKIRQTILNAKQYPYIVKIGVFGSYARGDILENSDLDIIIDYDDSSDVFMDNMGNFMEDLELVFIGKVDYLTLPGLMKSKDDRFKNNVLREVQWVYDSKISEN